MELNEDVIDVLKSNKSHFDEIEKNPDSENLCYVFTKKIIDCYKNIDIENIREIPKTDKKGLPYTSKPDIDLLFSASCLKFNPTQKKERINESCLNEEDKKELCIFIENHSDEEIGIFGTGTRDFGRFCNLNFVKNFIKLCCEIKDISDNETGLIYEKVKNVLDLYENENGSVGVISQILHCIKPKLFPIVNTNEGNGNFFSQIKNINYISKYIDNCNLINEEKYKFNQKIKDFYGANFIGYENYRIYDLLARCKKELIDFKKIATFFEKYGRQPYTKDDKEKKNAGQNASREFQKFLDEIKIDEFQCLFSPKSYIYGQNNCYCSEYFWGQYKKYSNEPYSISVSISLDKNKNLELYVKTEIYDNAIKQAIDSDKQMYIDSFAKSAKNIPPNGFYSDTVTIEGTDFDKTNIIKKINLNQEQNNIINDTREAIQKLIPNYLAIFQQEGNNMNTETKPALNQILYGPPGTGKTYNTVVEAIRILDEKLYKEYQNSPKTKEDYRKLKDKYNQLKKLGQIEFVTFHQSYSYEEFVEGIKPDLTNENLKYIQKPGIFRKICKNAEDILNNKDVSNFDFENISLYKLWLSGNNVYDYCIQNNCIVMGWANDIDFSGCDTEESIQTLFPIDYSQRTMALWQIKFFKYLIDKDIKENKNVIVIVPGSQNTIRAIGYVTGGYEYKPEEGADLSHQRKVTWLKKDLDLPSFYDAKFVPPTITGMFLEKVDRDIMMSLINNKESSRKCVLVIDEINRGNISKIFGELITLIESDKRIGAEHELKVILPYSNDPFGIPKNLYIIGTMNTADRSIASVDIALRRRFRFIEMMPKPELLRKDGDAEGENPSPWDVIPTDKAPYQIDLQLLLQTLNDRISYLIDPDHQIGHSYFLNLLTDENGNKVTEIQEQAIKDVFQYEILPLLNEYFYGDWEKLKAVLINYQDDEKQEEALKQSFIKRTHGRNENNLYKINNCEEKFAFKDIQTMSSDDFEKALSIIINKAEEEQNTKNKENKQ